MGLRRIDTSSRGIDISIGTIAPDNSNFRKIDSCPTRRDSSRYNSGELKFRFYVDARVIYLSRFNDIGEAKIYRISREISSDNFQYFYRMRFPFAFSLPYRLTAINVENYYHEAARLISWAACVVPRVWNASFRNHSGCKFMAWNIGHVQLTRRRVCVVNRTKTCYVNYYIASRAHKLLRYTSDWHCV